MFGEGRTEVHRVRVEGVLSAAQKIVARRRQDELKRGARDRRQAQQGHQQRVPEAIAQAPAPQQRGETPAVTVALLETYGGDAAAFRATGLTMAVICVVAGALAALERSPTARAG